ncbi:MAG: hypothetical protein AAF493_10790 [Pseudomonadota bacterium]
MNQYFKVPIGLMRAAVTVATISLLTFGGTQSAYATNSCDYRDACDHNKTLWGLVGDHITDSCGNTYQILHGCGLKHVPPSNGGGECARIRNKVWSTKYLQVRDHDIRLMDVFDDTTLWELIQQGDGSSNTSIKRMS